MSKTVQAFRDKFPNAERAAKAAGIVLKDDEHSARKYMIWLAVNRIGLKDTEVSDESMEFLMELTSDSHTAYLAELPAGEKAKPEPAGKAKKPAAAVIEDEDEDDLLDGEDDEDEDEDDEEEEEEEDDNSGYSDDEDEDEEDDEDEEEDEEDEDLEDEDEDEDDELEDEPDAKVKQAAGKAKNVPVKAEKAKAGTKTAAPAPVNTKTSAKPAEKAGKAAPAAKAQAAAPAKKAGKADAKPTVKDLAKEASAKPDKKTRQPAAPKANKIQPLDNPEDTKRVEAFLKLFSDPKKFNIRRMLYGVSVATVTEPTKVILRYRELTLQDGKVHGIFYAVMIDDQEQFVNMLPPGNEYLFDDDRMYQYKGRGPIIINKVPLEKAIEWCKNTEFIKRSLELGIASSKQHKANATKMRQTMPDKDDDAGDEAGTPPKAGKKAVAKPEPVKAGKAAPAKPAAPAKTAKPAAKPEAKAPAKPAAKAAPAKAAPVKKAAKQAA